MSFRLVYVALICCGLAVVIPAQATAAEEIMAAAEPSAGGKDAESPPAAEAAKNRRAVKAIVTGLFVEARVGGGYMVLNTDLGPPHEDLGGSEKLGAGSVASLAVGYDVTDSVALRFQGGGMLVSGGRGDVVRDLSLVYGGVAAQIALEFADRISLMVIPGGAYVSASNSVEAAQAGMAATLDVGLEYTVHVRHFSVGLMASVFVPLSPMRAFVSIVPTLQYTF